MSIIVEQNHQNHGGGWATSSSLPPPLPLLTVVKKATEKKPVPPKLTTIKTSKHVIMLQPPSHFLPPPLTQVIKDAPTEKKVSYIGVILVYDGDERVAIRKVLSDDEVAQYMSHNKDIDIRILSDIMKEDLLKAIVSYADNCIESDVVMLSDNLEILFRTKRKRNGASSHSAFKSERSLYKGVFPMVNLIFNGMRKQYRSNITAKGAASFSNFNSETLLDNTYILICVNQSSILNIDISPCALEETLDIQGFTKVCEPFDVGMPDIEKEVIRQVERVRGILNNR